MVAGLAGVRGGVAACAEAPLWPLSESALLDALDSAYAAQTGLMALQARLVAEIERRGVAKGSGTVALVRDRLRVTPWAARKMVDLARSLERRPHLLDALTTSAVNVEQASCIGAAVEKLAGEDDVTGDLLDRFEAALVERANWHDAGTLGRMATQALAVVAPEIADRAEAVALAREEARAERVREVRLSRPIDGTVRLSGLLSVEDAATVSAALDPLCQPKPDDARNPGQRRADALVDVCRLALACGELPVNGGDRPQVVVTVPFDVLAGALGAGMLDSGEGLSAATVRRLACDAAIIPAVLGAHGQVLDMGRAQRLFTGPLRRALILRDGGCAFPGCERPPRWADGHHIVHWQDGGSTSLDNAVLLCRTHHRLVHQSDWRVRLKPDGRPEFIPPSAVDPQQRPRTNLYHRRH